MLFNMCTLSFVTSYVTQKTKVGVTHLMQGKAHAYNTAILSFRNKVKEDRIISIVHQQATQSWFQFSQNGFSEYEKSFKKGLQSRAYYPKSRGRLRAIYSIDITKRLRIQLGHQDNQEETKSSTYQSLHRARSFEIARSHRFTGCCYIHMRSNANRKILHSVQVSMLIVNSIIILSFEQPKAF